MISSTKGLRLDLGCGSTKKEGTLGIDILAAPCVDHIINLEKDALPFDDKSVAYVFSSHFLEHLRDPTHVYAEIGRVCEDGARIELWTPYAWSNPAFIIDHKFFFAEDVYLHMCVWFTDFWAQILGARWVLHEIQYVVDPWTLCYLKDKGVSLDFAVRHLQNIVTEFCVHITVSRSPQDPPPIRRTFSTNRFAPRYELKADSLARPLEIAATDTPDGITQGLIQVAIQEFAVGGELPELLP